MTRRTTCTLAVAATVALAPAVALANGGSGPQGELVICHEGDTLTIPAAQWWPYGYLGATKGACPEPTPTATPVATPETTPTSTPESSPTPRPTPEPTVVPTATQPTPIVSPVLPVLTPAPEPTPASTPVASSTAVVPRPAHTGQGTADRAGGLRAALLAPTVAVALLFGARTATRERGAR